MSQSEVLASLLKSVEILSYSSPAVLNITVPGISDHSGKVRSGDVFFAIPGVKQNGEKFIADALAAGASVIIAENIPAGVSFPYIQVANVRLALAAAAKHHFAEPSANFLNIAVTGTNGKTTTAWIVAETLARMGTSTAYIGTLGMHLVEASTPYARTLQHDEKLTTPGSFATYAYLERLREASAKAAVMEVSSHAIAQERVAGIEWDCAIFTNLTRDHLDFHGTLENYAATKERLFSDLLANSPHQPRIAAINIDDGFGAAMTERLRKDSRVEVITYSARGNRSADCYLSAAKLSSRGSELEVSVRGESHCLNTRFIGDYNVDNTLAAFSCLIGKGFEAHRIISALASVPPVPGRLELVSESGVPIFIDYAHTPDALQRAQNSVKGVTTGRLITVFGCGGDRDRGKRPLMGQEVAQASDLAIVTSDNPRTEDPAAIINDILPGLTQTAGKGTDFKYEVVVDRRAAIFRAVELAGDSDTVLIAGKGHEDYQEIKGVRMPFLDKAVSAEALKSLGK